MFFLQRPSDDDVERFLDRSRELPLSYCPVGIAKTGAARGRLDEAVARIGRGATDFARARDALMDWKHFDLSWVRIYPRAASIAVGTAIAVRIRHLGFWSLNGARVVYHLDDTAASFGFAYGTLTNHAEHGEELFEIFHDPRSDDVVYRIRAVSRPQAWLAGVGYLIVRSLQSRFRRESAAAIARAVAHDHGFRPNRRS